MQVKSHCEFKGLKFHGSFLTSLLSKMNWPSELLDGPVSGERKFEN